MGDSAPAASLRFDTAGNTYSVLHRVMCYLGYLRKYFSSNNDRLRYYATSRRNMEGSEQEATLGNITTNNTSHCLQLATFLDYLPIFLPFQQTCPASSFTKSAPLRILTVSRSCHLTCVILRFAYPAAAAVSTFWLLRGRLSELVRPAVSRK